MVLTPPSAFAAQAAPLRKPPSILSLQMRLPSTCSTATMHGKTSKPPSHILHKTSHPSVSKPGTAPSPRRGFRLLTTAMESNSATPCSLVIPFQQLMENQSAFPSKTPTSPLILSRQGSSQQVSNSRELPHCKRPAGVQICTGPLLPLQLTARQPSAISNPKTPKQPPLMHWGMVTSCTAVQQLRPLPPPPLTSLRRHL